MKLPHWRYETGRLNAITDVAGVQVGHADVYDPGTGACSGVTCVVPAADIVTNPLPAAVHVINGYGKSVGLVQIDELGTLESPVVLSSVFALPRLHAALADLLMAADPTVGDPEHRRSANAVVLECNDCYMHDPSTGRPDATDLDAATEQLSSGAFDQGAVGAGTGMTTFGMSGAIGSASRTWTDAVGVRRCLGALVLSNYGLWGDLTVAGTPVQGSGESTTSPTDEAAGSVIVVLATDAPADAWLLRRVARRAQNGLARTGCTTASRSGEIVLAFCTQRVIRPATPAGLDGLEDALFRVAAEAVEAAVLSGVEHAARQPRRIGRLGRRLPTYADLPGTAVSARTRFSDLMV